MGARNILAASCLLESSVDVIPVGNVEYRLDVVGPHVFVLQIVSVFPDVDTEERHEAGRSLKRVLVRAGGELKPLVLGVVAEPAPAGALNADGDLGEAFLQLFQTAEVLLDLLEKGGVRIASIGRQVLPEDRMIEMTATVELDSRPQGNLGANVAL